ncbi:MAG: autotransporter outer membrane beta-barrel domain-containing protein, partial [Phascolarctobacterium sp.]|nr:autotransporter outer membrane beta-barrel domain-containing protein [Candidatus Phascolarctobacterium equi]
SGAALTAATVNVDSVSTLTLNNAKKNTTVQIIDGTATGGWADAEAKQYTADETPEGLNVGDKVKLFTINKDGGFVITIDKAGASFVDPSDSTEDGIPTSIVNVATLMSDSEDEKVQKFMDALSDIEDAQGSAAASNAVETVANMSAVAGVQSGTASMVNSIVNNLSFNLGSSARPNLMSGSKGGLRNTANDNGEVKIDTVEVGKAADVMPERYLAKAYNKEVWASYIHSKQRVDGLKAGMLSNQSTMQYNGVTVGADLWSGKHSFGGVALSYADGNINAGNLRNDTDYYGVSIYNRHDYKGLIMLTDVSYTHSKNDINISGVQEITADAKADAIGVGVRFETPVTMGKTTVTPYAGARYTYLKNKDYKNNLGMEYDTDNQNLVTIPVGLQISAEFAMSESDWTFRPVLEGGYVWNLGDRDGNTKIGYMDAYDSVGFETSDPGQYFIRAAMQFAKADFTCEVGYRYSKGKSVRDNRWNVNMNYAF